MTKRRHFRRRRCEHGRWSRKAKTQFWGHSVDLRPSCLFLLQGNVLRSRAAAPMPRLRYRTGGTMYTWQQRQICLQKRTGMDAVGYGTPPIKIGKSTTTKLIWSATCRSSQCCCSFIDQPPGEKLSSWITRTKSGTFYIATYWSLEVDLLEETQQ